MENDLPPAPNSWKNRLRPVLSWLPAGLGVLGIIAGGTYLLFSPKFYNALKKNVNQSQPDQNISVPNIINPLPIAHGKQTYTVSGGIAGAPRIGEVTFDPLDPDKGSSMNLSVKTLDGTGVTEVTAILTTDTKNTESKLKLSEGTDKDGTWKITLKMDDSYDYKYSLTVKAKNTGGKVQSITVTVR
jgi:hypothetical protein